MCLLWALIVQQETGQHVFILNSELHFLVVEELTQELISGNCHCIFVFLAQD